MKSWNQPTAEEVSKVVGLLNQAAQKSYFFDNLKNPLWIGPLYEKGFFKNPPPPKRDEKEGTIQLPIWPESKYLARIASETATDSSILTKIIAEIQTDNIRVKEDLLEIVSKLPVDAILSQYAKVIKYLEGPYVNFSLVPQKIADLIERLSIENKFEEALKIARYLLHPIPEIQTKRAKEIGLSPNPKAKFEIWDYQQILKNKLNQLKTNRPIESLDLFINILFAAIRISRANEKDKTSTYDYLHISRRSIKNQSQSHSHEFEGSVISEIVSLSKKIIDSNPEKFEEVIKILESKKYNYFKKIVIYLLAEYPHLDRSRVISYIKDQKIFDAGWASIEYDELLSKNFSELIPEDQKIIIDRIENGPDIELFIQSEKTWTGNEPLPANVLRYKELWQLNHLDVLKDHISGSLRDKFDVLAAKYPQYNDKIPEGVWSTANESPKKQEELEKMSIDQIINLLKEWKQVGDGFNGKPTIEGLSQVLREVVKIRAIEFSEMLDQIENFNQSYIFSILFGIEEGLKKDPNINWNKTLGFLEYIISLPKEEADTAENPFKLDQSTRRQAISILNAGLRLSVINISERERIWRIIEVGLSDPDPTVTDEEKYDEALTHAINSVRGEVLHSVVEYALWIRRYNDKLTEGEALAKNGFKEMPEVQEILNARLITGNEPTKAVRSVYGRYLPWLYLLDSEWTSSKLKEIFTHNEKVFGDAAWDAYIVYTSPYNNLFPPLKSEYEYRVKNAIFPEGERKNTLREPNNHLVEHIAVYYWRNKIKLDDPLIRLLTSTANLELLSHLISFMGRVIYGEKNTPPEIIQRSIEIWEYIFSHVSKIPDRTPALKGFAWWFASNQFESEWLLSNLENVIDVAKGVDDEDFILDNLLVLSNTYPERSVIILEKILKTATKPWIVLSSEKEIMGILENAHSSNEASREIAKRVVNYLVKKQLFKFREILK